MSLRHRYLQLVGTLIPAGLFGMSAVLASTAAEASTTGSAGSGVATQEPVSVAGRLEAIRDAVTTTIGGEGRVLDPNVRLAWWGNGDGRGWGNGGHAWGNAGHPGWGNGGRAWGNGHGGWANWRN